MFSKAFLTLVALAALSIAAPIANFEGSAGDYQYLSRRGNPSRPAPHRSASLPPPAQHDQHGSTSHSGRPAPHRSASLPLPAPHNQHGSTSHSHGNSPPHSPHPAHAGGSHHGTPAHSPHNTPHHTPPHSPTHAHASGSQHGSHPHQHLISEVQAAGHKISAADVVHIWRLPRPIPNVNGQHAWLEKGSATAGMQHIMHKHGAEFAAKGITEHQIPHLAEKATTSGEIVGTQGSSRTIYKTQHNGQTEHVAVETGKNGFVVGMNPSSEKSAQKAAKAWKKKLAKDAATPPDQHPGKGPGPGPGPTGGAGAGAITTRR